MDWMKKLYLVKRVLLATIGTILLVVASFAILQGYQLPGLGYEYELEGKTYYFDFSLIILAVVFLVGLGMVIVAFKLSTLSPNVITSFPYSRFIPGILLVLMGFVFYLIFGISFGEDNPDGAWLFLGGPSLFFPTSLFPMIFGTILLVYSAFAFARFSFMRQDGNIIIHELRFPRPMVTTIPIDDIDVIRLTNTRTGPKFLWIIPFIISIVYLYTDAIAIYLANVANPIPNSTGYLAATAYAVSATVQLFSMLLLILNTQHFLEIITKDRLYELHVAPANLYSLLKLNLALVLQEPSTRNARVVSGEPGKDGEKAGSRPGTVKVKQPTDFKPLLTGTFFIVLGVISRVYHVFAGEMTRFALIIIGIVLVVESMKNDMKFIHGNVEIIQQGPGGPLKVLGRGVLYRSEYFIARVPILKKECSIVEGTSCIQLRKMNLLHHLVITGVPFFLGMQAFPTILLLPPHLAGTVGATNVFLTLAVMVLLVVHALNPTRMLKFPLGDRNVAIPVSMDGGVSGNLIARIFGNFQEKYRVVLKTQLNKVFYRLGEIIIAFLLGIAASAVLWF